MKNDLQLFQKIAIKLLDEENKNPVTKPIEVDKLWDKLNISLQEQAISETQFEEVITQIILHTPKTSTHKFFNQLFGGRNSKATLGDLLAVLLNNSMYTYKVAGVQVGIEKEIIQKVCSIIKYPVNSSGTITSGGSMSNLIAMLMARDKLCPEVRQQSYTKKLVGYTSESSHYSIKKNAAICGIGAKHIRVIPTDNQGVMNTINLENAITEDLKKGFHPFFINATAGTTVLGAFDPVEAISKIAKKYKIWLHVDGAYCGSVIFSKKYTHLIDGVSQADSFNFNAHKMIGVPLTCSVLVTQNKKHLYNSLSIEADYLYQTDADDFNLGKTSLQCGRRNNALKFWTLWKSVGTNGLEKIVNQQFQLANFARNYIKNHKEYTLYSFDNSISVCFNYKNIPAAQICTALYEQGKLMVGFGTFRENTFIRLVTINPKNTESEILDFFKTIETFVDTE